MPTTPDRGSLRRDALACLATAALGMLFGCARQRPAEPAEANDNRRAAGEMHGGVLELELEIRPAIWHPEGPEGPALPVHAFAERGGIASVPGPLVRVTQGTTIRLTIVNTLADSTLVLHGLAGRPEHAGDSLVLPPGARQELRFDPGPPGTYYYWGSTTHSDIDGRQWLDSQLSGAIVVDSAGATADDRVFVLGIWTNFPDRPGPYDPDTGEVMTINGRAWPHTERFRLPVGDSVTWRWVNVSNSSHPMHLHGVYFEVAHRGDAAVDTAYPAGRRPLEVTELMLEGGTMLMRWAPARPGNWIFHCHFAAHVSALASMDYRQTDPHRHMAGLVLGIEAMGVDRDTVPPPHERQLRLLVQSAAGRIRGGPGYGYVLQRGAVPPAADSIEIPGSPIILTRGEPVAITVVNHLAEPTAVHWHGMELESFPDGVPDWSGAPARLFRAIAPGDSFTARFTPPRAGTFIYHSHDNEVIQSPRGLYGPLLVLEPGERYDAEQDRLVVVGGNGPVGVVDSFRSRVNGAESPPALRLVRGRSYRFRLISIDVDRRILFTLWRGDSLASWQALAKDGATLPASLATVRPATLLTGPGETADFRVTPDGAGPWRLDISAPYVEQPWTIPLPLDLQ